METRNMDNMKELLLKDLEQASGGRNDFPPLPDSPEFKAYVDYRNYLMKKYNTTIGSMLQKIATAEEWAKFLELFEAYRTSALQGNGR